MAVKKILEILNETNVKLTRISSNEDYSDNFRNWELLLNKYIIFNKIQFWRWAKQSSFTVNSRPNYNFRNSWMSNFRFSWHGHFFLQIEQHLHMLHWHCKSHAPLHFSDGFTSATISSSVRNVKISCRMHFSSLLRINCATSFSVVLRERVNLSYSTKQYPALPSRAQRPVSC